VSDPGENRPSEFNGKGKNTLILFPRAKPKGAAE
jgi:hypothetical protein